MENRNIKEFLIDCINKNNFNAFFNKIQEEEEENGNIQIEDHVKPIVTRLKLDFIGGKPVGFQYHQRLKILITLCTYENSENPNHNIYHKKKYVEGELDISLGKLSPILLDKNCNAHWNIFFNEFIIHQEKIKKELESCILDTNQRINELEKKLVQFDKNLLLLFKESKIETLIQRLTNPKDRGDLKRDSQKDLLLALVFAIMLDVGRANDFYCGSIQNHIRLDNTLSSIKFNKSINALSDKLKQSHIEIQSLQKTSYEYKNYVHSIPSITYQKNYGSFYKKIHTLSHFSVFDLSVSIVVIIFYKKIEGYIRKVTYILNKYLCLINY